MARMRAQDRRRQLLTVAADVFARHGYHGTTTSRLAEAAGISEPVLYRHFESKQDLFVTLVNEVSEEVITAWRTSLDGVDDPDRRLRILLAGNPATHMRGRGIYRVLFHAMTEAESNRAIAQALRRHVQRLHRFITTQLGALQHDGVVRDDQPAGDLAWLLVSLAVGYGIVQPVGIRGASTSAARLSMQELLHDMLAG
ncbi:MAG: TetR/AcrR family transcriptional regulator [Planctomycetota bacterium]